MSASASIAVTPKAEASTNKSHLFLDLPPELHLKIATKLPIAEKMALRHTNKYFLATIPELKHEDLLEAEMDDSYAKKNFACLQVVSQASS